MKLVNLSIAAAAACVLATSAHALKTEDRVLKGNMQVEYTKVPGDVNSFSEMFTEGSLYGRLRSNMFWYDWENQDKVNADKTKQTRDDNQWGLGGSLVYKTAFFHGVGATAGFYGSVPAHSENTTVPGMAVNYGKSGKDTYRTEVDGSEAPLAVLAEAYLEYKTGKTDIKVGRQMIDTTMLASNDTKMVPNTFEAAVVENKDIKDTKLRAGYITQQKLRDHQTFHSILAYNEVVSPNKTNPVAVLKVQGNDDSGVHKGLTFANIAAAGKDTDPEMIFADFENKSIPGLKLNGEYYGIDGFFSTIVAEANYKIKLNDEWTLTPGVRYLRQMDDGAGAIGGAALSGNVVSTTPAKVAAARANYTNPDSVDGNIIMARLVAANGPLELQVGYSKIGNEADIIAPWRGFPTGGYTRSMAQVDWIANTQNWALKASYDFGKAGLVPGMKVIADYEDMNFDDAKAYTSGFTDRNIIHVDVLKTFKEIPNAEFKFRFATVAAENAYTSQTVVSPMDYTSYDEYRFEINYLF